MPQAFVTLFCEAIKAVLRTLSGHRDVAPCRIRSPGKRSATGGHAGTLAGRQKRKKPIRQDGLFTCLMPGSSLLSHGETPHYHRRYGVSLLSSAWGQVGPPRYRRQANSLCSSCVFCAHTALAALASVSHILMYASSIASFAALSQRKILRTLNQS